MRQTLFHVPNEIAGMPLFGFGLLLAVWVAGGLILLVWPGRRKKPDADTWSYLILVAAIGAVIWFLLPKLCEADGLPIRGFGVMLLVAVTSGVALAVWRGRRMGVDPEMIFTITFWCFLPGILGARLFFIIQKWPQQFASIYENDGPLALVASLANIAQGGIVFYGSLIGGMLGMAACILVYKLPALPTLDLFAPSLMLGMAVGRIGCLMNGCCYGGVCDLPWAVTFPAGSPPHVEQVFHGQTFLHGLKILGEPAAPPVITQVEPGSEAQEQGFQPGQQITAVNDRQVSTIRETLWVLLHAHAAADPISVETRTGEALQQRSLTGSPQRSEPVQPTQIYSAINALLLCLFLLACSPHCRRDGQLFAIMLTLYPLTRFLLEIIRTDEQSAFGTGLTISQNVSLIALVAAIGLWTFILTRTPRFNTPSISA